VLGWIVRLDGRTNRDFQAAQKDLRGEARQNGVLE
jgi:hypothetical protein